MSKAITPPKNAQAGDIRAMLGRTRPDAVTVLDVRQDWEYEEFHLPGAVHLPLADLEDRMGEVPRDKPLVIYCHSGRRSAAAASLLASEGHPDVTNMLGGIMAWKGGTAVGGPDTGMQHYRGDETPDEILALAFAMERELGAFYEGLAAGSQNEELRTTFKQLAGFEDKHKLVVYHLYKSLHPESASIEDLASKAVAKVMEGGRAAGEVLAEAEGFEQAHDALDMAMGVEAQALDLYMRYAAVAGSVEAVDTLHQLANEERGHLRALATLMDKLGEKKS